MQHDVSEPGVCDLELLRRAIVLDDQGAWEGLRRPLGETILAWLRRHPRREEACRLLDEERYVALTFERLRWSALRGEAPYETLAGALLCLLACLNGAILEMLRVASHPGNALARAADMHEEERSSGSEAWERLEAALPDRREQRLAYLLYHCGLDPAEIMRRCPAEWGDLEEIARLRRVILERVLLKTQQPSLAAHARQVSAKAEESDGE